MTGPKEPGDDWGFPEVDPASPALPPPADEVEDLTEPSSEHAYDTGSDAWWRAQQEAQRQAAAAEPVVPPSSGPPAEPPPPPPLVEPTVLNQPSPLDATWVPPELPELRPSGEEPVAEPVAAEEPVAEEPAYEEEPVAYEEPAYEEPAYEEPAYEEPAYEEPAYEEPAYEESADEEPADAVAAQRVGPARALAGAALALLGVVLAIGALFVFNGKDEPKSSSAVVVPPSATATPSATSSTAQTPTPSPSQVPAVVPTTTKASATATPPAQAPVVPVSVLNNSRIKGLADRASARFRAGGWPVATTGNYRGGNLAQTTVYYAPGQQASAERFAKQFGIPRVAPRFPGIPVQGMTVILTRDYRA